MLSREITETEIFYQMQKSLLYFIIQVLKMN